MSQYNYEKFYLDLYIYEFTCREEKTKSNFFITSIKFGHISIVFTIHVVEMYLMVSIFVICILKKKIL